MSCHASQNLGLVTIASDKASKPRPEIDQLVQDYDDLFHGLGKFKSYHAKYTFKSTKTSSRPSEKQLEKDKQNGVIERVDGPTPLVSPVVVTPKPKLCVDMGQPIKHGSSARASNHTNN